jgi:hypothetical protein
MPVYLRYDHSAGPGPRDDEFIGSFSSRAEARSFKAERFSPQAPVTVVEMDEAPPEALTMTPEEAARYARN